MGFFSSLGSGLSNIGSSVGNWMSNPANQDKLNAWGQELYALGNPGAKTDIGAIYSNYTKHKQQPMGNTAAAPDAYAMAAAATPPAEAPVAPSPLQMQPMQFSPNGVYQPYGQGLPQGTNPIRLTVPTIKLGGY